MSDVGRPRRVLVVANETCPSGDLCARVRERSGDAAEVRVVAPALNTRLRWMASDDEHARNQASERLARSLANLRAAGLDAEGEVGDEDPLLAIQDALATFDADEIVIATHPAGRSAWLERGVVEKAREAFAAPVTHVEIDIESDVDGA